LAVGIELVLCTAACLLLIPSVVLCAEVLFAPTGGSGAGAETGMRKRLAILIPAHDEASIIGTTIRSILPQLDRIDRLVVIADNCGDSTAAVAASAGAAVIERRDPDRRGKGYALDFGVRHLEADPPETVIVVDADCSVAAGAIDTLARMCSRTDRPVQALYLLHAILRASPRARIAEFALTVKNKVRPSGLQRLGLPCQLMGTGMAFPWASIRGSSLASGHIVEDMRLGIDLTLEGHPPMFCPGALVTSTFPESSEGTKTQRTRWEHGHLLIILQEAPRMLLRGLLKMDLPSLSMALDIAVPPLALLVLLLSALWSLSLVFWLLTKGIVPLTLATGALGLLALSVIVAWRRFGRDIVSASDLGHAILYALWKLPIYAKFLVARQLDWVRSKRG
jgi:cellulose synthase/poly-beta-1,6-N-acetylglucosamine synthase-like glycosyltransferase